MSWYGAWQGSKLSMKDQLSMKDRQVNFRFGDLNRSNFEQIAGQDDHIGPLAAADRALPPRLAGQSRRSNRIGLNGFGHAQTFIRMPAGFGFAMFILSGDCRADAQQRVQ